MWVYLLLAARAQPAPPGEAGWDELPRTVLEAFDQGAGRAGRAAAAGADEAAARVGLGPAALRVESQIGLPQQEQLLVAAELPLATGARERLAWRARSGALAADVAEEGWRFALDTIEIWRAWWLATVLARDLEAYAAQVERDLVRLNDAVEAGSLARLELADIQAELVQVRGEIAGERAKAARARVLLSARLGERAPTDAEIEPPPRDNPWRSLAGAGAASPDTRAAAARAEAAQAESAALGARRAPSLQGGPMWARDAAGQPRSFGFVGLSVPLRAHVAPERRAALGEAAAARLEQRWLADRAEDRLLAEAEAHDAEVAHLDRVESEVLSPLAARLALLEGAFAEGLVTTDRLGRARRAHHEAEHEALTATAELLASQARARVFARLVEEGS